MEKQKNKWMKAHGSVHNTKRRSELKPILQSKLSGTQRFWAQFR